MYRTYFYCFVYVCKTIIVLNKMAGLEYKVERYFPLVSVQSVVTLFNYQLGKGEEIDLAFLSIVIGCIEHTLTVNRLPHGSDDVNFTVASFPVLEYKTVEALYCKFRTFIKGNVDLTKFPSSCATRELIKSVSDVIWRSLTRAYYKDRAHLQSLFSFLTGVMRFFLWLNYILISMFLFVLVLLFIQ